MEINKEAPKQESWFHTDVDFENSFKFWFALQWQNKFILLFLLGLGMTIGECIRFNDVITAITDNFNDGAAGGIFTILACLIGPAITITVAYKGFWQYFQDLKNGTSR